MKERKEKIPHAALVRQIEEILEVEGPCSLTKITRLVNERSPLNGNYDRTQISVKIEEMRRDRVVSTCFYPGDPPEELKKADVYYGYFLSKDEERLVGSGVIGEGRTYSINEIARDEDIKVPFSLRDIYFDDRHK